MINNGKEKCIFSGFYFLETQVIFFIQQLERNSEMIFNRPVTFFHP